MALYQGLVLRFYRLDSDKIPADRSIRLALLTDLHSNVIGPGQSKLWGIISREKPDLILLAGDICDAGTPFDGDVFFLERINKLAPTFYVTGNHEFRSGKIDTIRKECVRQGICLLSDEYQMVTVKNTSVIIAGIDDPVKTEYEDENYHQPDSLEKAFEDLRTLTTYRILLAHRPEQIDLYKEYAFDLVVSGHTHGGQVRIPFLLNGLWSPHQGLCPKYGGGLYRQGETTLIVSRGLVFRWQLPRVFNRPEVVFIDIYGTDVPGEVEK